MVVNDDWPTGMGGSLRVGLAALDDDVDRVVVALVDHVGLTTAAVARLVASSARLAAAAYEGERRNPVLIGREHWAGVAASAVGDRGARDFLDAHTAEVELVEVGDVATAEDVDRPVQRPAPIMTKPGRPAPIMTKPGRGDADHDDANVVSS